MRLTTAHFFHLPAVYRFFCHVCSPWTKQLRPKKGSFDWLYNQAEKGYVASLKDEATEQDYVNMRAVAEAYRTGNGVRQNLRLADCWEEMAQP